MNENHTSSKPGTLAAERRTADRAKVDLLINRFLDGYPYLCRASDISRTGMRLYPMREPAGAPRYMGLQFQLPGSDQVVTAAGEVVFSEGDKGAVGVRFTRLSPASAALIDRFLAAA